ncbi:DUF6538 domain-containing protein [Magnetovibrio blakemorei]|uniref:Core-binding (CB) domain-containing protein n=1 Tax=Magnetovibrio blakemorei TaxID=28181 RepID=A0A1E5Q328_9PROT|nr:DUF6538 domain-containing protein [Magnetovibrio blakemorei]OEJ64026.1 hypothetical protein BEN30_01050 [Magnetovibrio blakemorei]
MTKNILKQHLKWYAVLEIPKDLRGHFGKARFKETLKTDSEAIARRRAAPLIATWKGKIEAARTGTDDSVLQDIKFWQHALSTTTTEDEETIIRDFAVEAAEKLELQEEGAGVRMYKTIIGELIPTDQYIDEWLASLSDTSKTKDMKRREVERFAVVFPTLDTITKKAVKRWCVGLMGEGGLKLKTITKNLSFLRSYWSYLESVEVVSDEYEPLHNLGFSTKSSKASKQDETVPFSAGDVVKLRAEAEKKKDTKLVDLITLAMWSGARIEELCSLTEALDQMKGGNTWEPVDYHSDF